MAGKTLIIHQQEIELVRERSQDYSTSRGYTIIHPQLNLFVEENSDFIWLFDLASVERPFKPQIRIFWTHLPVSDLDQDHFNKIRSQTTDKSVGLIAFTNDGKHFRTIAAESTSIGSLSFIPRIINNSQRINTIEDLRPFLSIYELKQVVNILGDTIFSTHGHDRLKLFDTLLLLIATKIYDEVANSHNLQLPRLIELNDADCYSAFQNIALHALETLGCLKFSSKLFLDAPTLKMSISALIPFSLRLTVAIGTQAEVLSTFYQDIVSSTFRGSLGAYFTPKPLADLASSLCNSNEQDDILDMSCGSGTFLLSAFIHAQNATKNNKTMPRIFGCDIQERMALTTIINCFLYGMENHHVIEGDALKIDLVRWHQQDQEVPLEGFSLIVGNPPFAGFESSHSLPYEAQGSLLPGKGTKVNKIIPFITKTVQLLRPNGRAILVVPTSVLNGEGVSFRKLRDWLTTQVEMNTVIGVPREAFVHTDCGIEGAIIQFTKKAKPNVRNKVFFRSLDNVGYDRRGLPITGSQINKTIELWENPTHSEQSWIPLDDLYNSDRWDATWLSGQLTRPQSFSDEHTVSLTSLCEIIKRTLPKRDIQPEKIYRYFELGDTHIDTGAIMSTHSILGKDLHTKSRLQLPVLSGDILLPNHRDSLIAKTATRIGRSAVFVEAAFSGMVTSNRFTLLRPRIDPRLLIFILNSDFVREQLALLARGSASVDIRDKVLHQVRVPSEFIRDIQLQQLILEAINERQRLQADLNQADAKLNSFMSKIS